MLDFSATNNSDILNELEDSITNLIDNLKGFFTDHDCDFLDDLGNSLETLETMLIDESESVLSYEKFKKTILKYGYSNDDMNIKKDLPWDDIEGTYIELEEKLESYINLRASIEECLTANQEVNTALIIDSSCASLELIDLLIEKNLIYQLDHDGSTYYVVSEKLDALEND